MKVLHVWSTAGVGSLLAKYMDQIYLSFESDCIMRKKYDPYDLTVKGTVYKVNWFRWFLICLTKPRKYHIIHVHGYDRILPFLKILYPNKKFVIHYHGTEIRGNWKKRRFLYRLADKIIVSTPDLLEGAPPDVEYLPNPIDYDLIDEMKSPVKLDKAYHVDRYAVDLAKKYATEIGKELIILDRDRHGVSHKEFLTELTKYTYYIDVKRDFDRKTLIEALSLTAFEAAYVGVIVVNWKGELVKEFPKRHEKEKVCQALYRIYQEVLNG